MSFRRRPFRTPSAKAKFSFIWTFFQTAASKKLEKDCFGFRTRSEERTLYTTPRESSSKRRSNVILYNVTFLFIQSSLPISVTIIIKTVPTQRPRIYFEKDSLRRRAASLMFSRLPNALQRT
jgi:hypothetical protein